MPTTEQLAALVGAQWAWLILIDGSPYGFSSHRDLETHADFAGTGVDIRSYLQKDECSDLPTTLDPRTGQFDQETARLVLVDHSADNLLATLFSTYDSTQEPLNRTIDPGDDLSAETDLHGRHVGIEAIGSSGERRQYNAFRDFNVGLLHLGQNAELPDLEAAPVSDSPIVWRGRWVAVYQCFRDHVTYPDRSTGPSSWRPFSEARLRWWGTMVDAGRVDGRRWELEVDGQESLLRREVGMLTQQEPVRVADVIDLSTTEGEQDDRIAVGFVDGIHDPTSLPAITYDNYGTDTDFSETLTGTTALDILGEIESHVTTTAGTSGADGTFSTTNGHLVVMDPVEAWVSIAVEDATAGNPSRDAIMALVAHKRRWADIGYDVIEQPKLPIDDEHYVNFKPYPDATLAALGLDFGDAPGPGYYTGYFFTRPPEWTTENVDNDGQARVWNPLTTGARVVLRADLNGGRGQELLLAAGFDIIYHRGQLDRPPASDPDDAESPFAISGVGNVNRQGLWLFFGKRRFSNDQDPFDEYWVGRASWVSGAIAQEGQVSEGRIVVTEWLNPRRFGYDRPPPKDDWIALASGGEDFMIHAVPLLHFGYQPGSHLSRADIVIDRLLRSTGTSTGWWTDPPTNSVAGYSGTGDAVQDAGDNEPALTFGVRRDGEDADLGLGIPDEIIGDPISFGEEFEKLPGTELGLVKLSAVPGTNTEDLLDGLMRPHGWSWSLRGGAYGLQTIFDPIPLDGIDHVFTQAQKVDRRSTQDLRAFGPIDRFELEYNYAAYTEKYRRQMSFASPDKGKRYRPGGVPFKVKAPGMTTATGFRERMSDAARWWERRHFFLDDFATMPTYRAPVWVGDRVRVTEPRAVAPTGAYGITSMAGIVVGTRLSLADGVTTCKIFVHDDTDQLPRLHAVSARGIGYDDDNDYLYVADNWLAVPTAGTWADSAFFVEPSYSGIEAIGGDATIDVYQWNGESWDLNVTATVDDVVTTEGAAYLELSSVSGTYYYAMDTIVVFRPADVQTAQWVLDLYGVTCNSAGTFDSGTAGYPWEP